MSASSSPMRDNLPLTLQNNIPSTSQEYMPSTSQNYMQSMSQNYMPSTSQIYMPSTSQNYMPSTSQNYMPPSTLQNYMPSTSQNIISSMSQEYMPSTSQNYMPSTSQNYMPSTSQSYMPSTSQNYMPSTSQNFVNGIAPTQFNFRTLTLELDNICRLCMFQDERSDMFTNILDDSSLMDDIFKHFQIQVQSSDSRSKMICSRCLHYIKEWHRRITIANEAQLIQDFLTKKVIEKASKKSVTQNTAASEDISASENILAPENIVLQVVANPELSITDDKMFLQSDKEMNHSEELQITSSYTQTKLKKISKASSAASRYRNRKFKESCIICNRSSSKHSSAKFTKNLCVTHSKPHACLCENCNYVFPNKPMFISHYRHHLNLDKNTFLCRLCYQVLDCPRNSVKSEHKHQSLEKMFVCCSLSFLTMTDFALHKLQNHNASILMTPADIRKTITQSLTEHAFPSNVSEINQSSDGGPKLFTCLESNCNKVFSLMSNNCDHYREHAKIPKEYYICSSCLCKYDVENELKFQCSHINYLVTCHLCKLGFTSLHELAIHKIYSHNAIILCGADNLPGCPVCRTLFQSNIETRDHYITCFNLENYTVNNKSSNLIDFTDSSDMYASYNCKSCNNNFNSLKNYIEHSRKAHRTTIQAKDGSIRLCPLCDTNYTRSSFVYHVEKCTKSMGIKNTESLELFGCVYCKTVFTVFSASQFRKHVLFCKTFQELASRGLTYFQCLNCNFRSRNHPQCVAHANTFCIYFQLKIKYAMKADEKLKVEQRIQLLKQDSNISFQTVNIPPVVINYPSNVLTDNNNILWNTNSTLICNSKNFKTLGLYNYVCNKCENKFFNEHVFRHHLDSSGKACRIKISWYCTLCLLDFTNEVDYQAHLSVNLELIPVPIPIPLDISSIGSSLKTELLAEDSTSEMGDEDMQDLTNENNLSYAANLIDDN